MRKQNIEAIYPLAPTQQGILFHHLYNPHSTAYFGQTSYLLHGRLDLPVFEQAWQRVVDRHAALRTAFAWDGLKEPVQVVGRRVSLRLEVEDWRALPADEQERRMEAYLAEDRRRGFDLRKAPLIRCVLIQLSDLSHRFIWSHHHIVLDGWSSFLLIKDAFTVYDALSRGAEVALEQPRPYSDYIAWLRQQDLKRAEEFWRATLEGFDAPTPLPTARAAGHGPEGEPGYATQASRLSAEATAALKELGRARRLTMSTVVQGAWALLLGRYSASRDVLFGVTVSGRPAELSGVERMVGLFINTLPLRVEVESEKAVGEWLRGVQERQVEARQYEYSPLVEVKRWAGVGEELFESIVVFENYPVDAALQKQLTHQDAALELRDLRAIAQSNYPLNLVVSPGEQLQLRISYDTSRFEETAVRRMLGQLEVLLEGIARGADRPVAELPWMRDEEREQVLREWNNTTREYLTDFCLHELFEQQAARTPDATAVTSEAGRLTYRELNARANQLAHYLRRLGVGPEVLVGVCLERSIEMVVALLGILKAGGAYLPLDPAYPLERLSFMIEDAGVQVLLTQESLQASLPSVWGHTLCLDSEWELVAAESAQNPGGAAAAGNLAYVIYTSGSTGKPKGVMVGHRSLLNYLCWINEILEGASVSALPAVTSLSFDASLKQLLAPLLRGGEVWLVAGEVAAEPSALLRALSSRERAGLNCVPSLWAAVLEVISSGRVEAPTDHLTALFVGGEQLSAELVERTLAALPRLKIWNLYGPTETTANASAGRIDSAARINIGRPVANTQIYLLDQSLNPVPVGTPGELYVGGAGVARGYLNRAGLTAERFIPDPFAEGAPGRLYRTGDRGYHLPTGEIVFLGRNDQQVKVRGYRIELGEIEDALRRHASVREVVVTAHDDAGGGPQLAAYVVAEQGALLSGAELRQYLKERLPEYMIPSGFVMLDALPLMPNGKVDRRALPAPGQDDALLKSLYVAPRTPTEEMLAGLFAQVLDAEQVGRHDSFFDLGGHSLLATQLVSRAREVFGVEVSLRSLFDLPTVAELSEVIEAALRGEQAAEAPPVRPARRDGELPLSFAQQRLWFLDQLEPGSSLYNIPLAVRLAGALDTAALERTLSEIVRRHETLRTTFADVEGRPVQIIHPARPLRLGVEDLSALERDEREREAARLALEEAGAPFDLGAGPLLRVRLLRLGEEEHVLLFTMHHIISDEWSTGVLVGEVSKLYEAYTEGRESPLEELPIQYADFAVWQREWLQGEVLERQLSYWREQLGGELPVLELPTDRPRPAVRSFRGAAVSINLSETLTQSLRQMSRTEGSTLFMLLLAAWQTLLWRYSGQDEVVVGTPIANRNRAETEGLSGFFVNTLLMRTALSADDSFRKLLRRVREVCLGAYAHQDVPFEKLVEELQPDRDLSRSPLFQSMFTLQTSAVGALALKGLDISPFRVGDTTTKFDLSCSFSETAEGLSGVLEYSTELFDGTTVRRMAGHLETLLEAVAAAPDALLSALPLLGEAERQRLLVEWNDTREDFEAEGQSIAGLFEQQVERTPSHVAVSFEGREVSYRELNERANRLAHFLKGLGVGPGVHVGLCMERGPEFVSCLLAVFKAGGVYVPLDLSHPQSRLAFMLEDAGVAVVLTHGRHLASLPACGARVVCVDESEGAVARESELNPEPSAKPDDLAYLIYTSGTTGRPKAVMVEHANLLNTILTSRRKFGFDPDDVVPVIASFSFDISLFELLPPLLSGARAVVFSKADVIDVPRLVDGLGPATMLHAVPSLMRQIVGVFRERGGRVWPGGLRRVYVGGDAVAPELLEQMQSVFAGSRIEVLYGPTEATIICASYEVPRGAVPRRQMIGRPLGNVLFRIEDRHGNPAPLGVAGELCIGGAGVTRGYLNREELSREKYVVREGVRYYRSGDLARYLADGNIEFLGRTDEQVKVRGFRVELGEIEAVLAEHPAVKECVVVPREDEADEKRLAAYLVCGEGGEAAVKELRRYLKERLPDYMIPSAFVALDALPLTPNGKVDRRALPAPDRAGAASSSTFLAPRTPTEEIIAGVFARVLELEEVSVNESFFEIGGHSLLATQVISRLRQVFGIELPLRSLFDGPTAEQLARAIEAGLGQEAAAAPAMEAVSREGELPLSFAQQRLWFIDQLEPGSSFYNIPAAVRMTGRLNVTALERTLTEVIRRHEVLRTSFPAQEGKPRQVIAPAAALRLEVEDLSGLPQQEREREAGRLAVEEARTPFDLGTGLMLRARLLRLAEEEHVLLFTMHHIISDGWSMSVLIKEVGALYEAFARGEESPLEELPIQYADFAVWQREWLRGEVLEGQLSYWRRQLGGELPVLELPTDRPRPPVQTYRGGHHSFRLSPEVSAGLRELSRKEGVTLFMTLLAAWQTLLSRYSGQEDIVVGTDIANRNRAETEGLIGFFVNQLVLRTDLAGDPTFVELLKRVREVCLGAYAHQDVPFEKLVEELQPERDASRSPLYQVMFVLQNTPQQAMELYGLKLSSLNVDSQTAKFDLVLTMTEGADDLGAALEYNTDLFDAATVRRLAEQIEVVMRGVAADPGRRLSELPLMTESEREQILRGWNRTARAYPHDSCLHELFEQQVERTPDATAVVYGDRQLTYAELNARANQLAHYLRGLGVGAEVQVGICLERSVEMVVGLLAILKAGGAYLPLDLSYPPERLRFMLEDAGVLVLLTAEHLVESLPAHWGHTICLDSEWETIAAQGEQNLGRVVDADNLAYVIYTSGSTGRPKGVMVTHRAVNRLVCNTDYVQVTASDRVAQASNSSFDAITFELWGALLNGARLSGVEQDVLLSPDSFARHLEQQGITVLFLTTALFNQLAQHAAKAFDGLRHVLFGGQAVDPRWPREVLRHGYAGRLLHVYGPTETTTYATWHLIEEVAAEARTIPIGKPIANTEAYVLDRFQQPVPVGVAGELYLGGDGLARGYLNRAGLTVEKFIPHPYSTEPGARLYRTGDVVRYLPDGNIEFLGRVDEQVKVRGFRIEPGEIEAVLAGHPAVRESIVIARDDETGNKQLVAYVVSEAGQRPDGGDLRGHLKERLPEYMVPAHFVTLDALPLTPNGKVDRRALPDPDQTRTDSSTAALAPRTPTEEIIAGVFARVLELEEVSVNESFFDIGGHSLLATQVISRVRELFGVEVSLRSLFEAATAAELSALVEGLLRGPEREEAERIEAAGRDGELPLSFAQQRLWFLDQLEPGSSLYNIPLALRLTGALDVAALEATLTEIVRRHEVLRTSFSTASGKPRQVIAPSAPLTLEAEDLSALEESEREREARRMAAEEAARPFDLSAGPLLRARLLRLAEEEHVLLFTMHHIISDGWSMGVLVKEVSALYQAFTEGRESPLEELPIQYADFAVWQRRWLSGEVLDRQLDYWRRQLGGELPVLEVPTDRPRPAAQSYRGGHHSFRLSPELSAGLRELSRREGCTLFMTLLAAWQTLLSRYSGQEDIVVGTPIANRNRGETEGLIGFFVNQLVLRTDMSGDPTFVELLGRVRDVCLGAYAHQDVPFEKLVEELQPERDASRSPLFQAVLVLQNVPMGTLTLPGLELSAVDRERDAVKYDLTLLVTEEEEGLEASLSYSADLFDEATGKRMVEHFATLAHGIASDPGRRLSELPLMTEAEREQLLRGWNLTASDYPRDRCLHDLFEQQAERTPDATAVTSEAGRLTYRELNARANQLAHYLRRLGVGPEVLVGVCLERGLELPVALLGILKAGGAYLPLDPAYPLDRLSFMIEDAGVQVLLTQESLQASLPSVWGHTLCLDSEWEAVGAQGAQNPGGAAAAGNLAYVIYTSGSTGKPKGVMVGHGALLNYLSWALGAYPVGEGGGAPLHSPVTFDLSVTALYLPLLCGGYVQMVGAGREAEALAGAVMEAARAGRRYSFVKLTPAHLQLLDEQLAEGAAGRGSVGALVVGGENLLWERVRPWLGADVRLYNEYGPTETVVGCCVYEAGLEGGEGRSGSVPIGRPVANTRLYILDGRGGPVPVGAAGELYIGGESLGRGYLRRPGLTAERFVPDAFSGEAGARLYRTGDLARYLPDGNIEYLGRIDNQVKVRGYRIELGEIEAALAKHAAVGECVVVAREQEGGDKRLVAYLVAEGGAGVNGAELREYLKGRLPDYMVPSIFVTLDALPLTPNGKVDRRALPAPGNARAASTSSFLAPRTPTEEIIAGVFAQVLELEEVSVGESFFELGGHSLLATQVVSRVRELFGVEVSLRGLFEAATAAELSALVEGLLSEAGDAGRERIEAISRERELPLSFAQQRLWFIDRLEPNNPFYNIPIVLRLTGQLNVSALERTLTEVVRRHEVLRTTFAEVEGQPAQLIHPSRPARLQVEDLSALEESERELEAGRLAAEEAVRPFDLEAGPLLRARLLRLAEEEHVLLFTMHHIVSDGWSMAVLTREVSTLYAAYVRGEESPLEELPIQYADFAVWQREWLSGEVLERQLSYWRRQLGGELPVLELPTDRPRPPVQTYRGGHHSFRLSPEVSAGLRELSRKEGVTLFMTLLAAWQTLLSRYSNQHEVVVGTDIANRNRAELEPLIGFFVNQLVMRTDLSGDPTFVELLKRVREVCLGAYAHQDVPFERLVEELRPERDAGRTPLYQVKFVWQNVAEAELELPGLRLRGVGGETRTAKMELMLTMAEAGGRITGRVEYNTDLYGAERVARMCGHLARLCESIVAQPDARINRLEILTAQEREEQALNENRQAETALRKLIAARRKVITLAPEA